MTSKWPREVHDPKKLLKIVNDATIKETEKLKEKMVEPQLE